MGFSNDQQLKKYVSEVFVETGTYIGDGVLTALNSGFEKVISVEIDEQKYKESNLRLKEHIDSGRVTLHLGDVVQLLPEIISTDLGKITFWLDAHDTYLTNPCPLYNELEIIKKYHRNDCTILIDDLRCIKNAIGWGMSVEFDSLIEKLKEINPDYHFEYEDGQDGHQNDILVAYIKN